MNAKQISLILLTLIACTNTHSMETEVDNTHALRRAILHWEIDNVRALIDQGISLATPLGRRPLLHLAIASNSRHMRTDIIQLLLDKGVDVNEKNEHNEWINAEVPLGLAIRCNAFDVITLLLARPNIDLNAQNNKNKTPLDLVIERQDQHCDEFLVVEECKPIIELLTKHGAKRSADL